MVFQIQIFLVMGHTVLCIMEFCGTRFEIVLTLNFEPFFSLYGSGLVFHLYYVIMIKL